MSVLGGLLHPDVERHLLKTEREFIIYQVERHWITRVPWVLLALAGMVVLISMPKWGRAWWLALALGVLAGLVAFWKIHVENMDRFVVTNLRVFRVNGVLNQKMASVPLARLLDITMARPFAGLLLDYGHFVFETAAQDQGLKKIAYVPHIIERDQTIQTVIQRAGIRARAGEVDEYADVFEAAEPRRPRGLAVLGRRVRRTIAPDANEIDGV